MSFEMFLVFQQWFQTELVLTDEANLQVRPRRLYIALVMCSTSWHLS